MCQSPCASNNSKKFRRLKHERTKCNFFGNSINITFEDTEVIKYV